MGLITINIGLLKLVIRGHEIKSPVSAPDVNKRAKL